MATPPNILNYVGLENFVSTISNNFILLSKFSVPLCGMGQYFSDTIKHFKAAIKSHLEKAKVGYFNTHLPPQSPE